MDFILGESKEIYPMKPEMLSQKRLKKLEETLQVEKNKLELAVKNRERELGKQSLGDDEVIERWGEELEELTAKLRGLREKGSQVGDLRMVRSELEGKDAQITHLESELNQRETELSDLKALLKRLESGLAEKEGSQLKLEAESTRLKAELKTRDDELKGLKKRLEGIQSELKDRISELEAEAKAKKKEVEKEMENHKKLKAALSEREAELAELDWKKKGLESELREVKERLKSKEEEAQGLKNKLEGWHATIREELDAAIEFITQQSEEINSLKAELTSYKRNRGA